MALSYFRPCGESLSHHHLTAFTPSCRKQYFSQKIPIFEHFVLACVGRGSIFLVNTDKLDKGPPNTDWSMCERHAGLWERPPAAEKVTDSEDLLSAVTHAAASCLTDTCNNAALFFNLTQTAETMLLPQAICCSDHRPQITRCRNVLETVCICITGGLTILLRYIYTHTRECHILCANLGTWGKSL